MVAFGFIYYVYGISNKDKIEAETEKSIKISFSFDSINNFLENCFKNLAFEAVDYVSLQGGYFTLPKKSYSEGIINTAFYFYEEYSLFPNLDVIENSISEYIKTYAHYCFEDLKNTTHFDNIDYKIENVSTKILNNNIIVSVYAPTKIKLDSSIHEFNNFNIELDNNSLYDVYTFNDFLIKEQLNDKYSLCLSCIINNGTEKNLFVDVTNVGNGTLIFDVKYNDTKINSLRRFVFANKYKQISCNNLPIDADEYLTNQLIKDCLEQQIQSYNYSLYVQDPIILIAQVGVPFESRIDAKGLNLQFEYYTDLFNIDSNTGTINFTPTEEQEGEHDTLLFVRDSFGNEQLRLINLTVLR